MTIVPEQYRFVIGVDTHAGSHTYASIDARTAQVDSACYPATPAGMRRALAWTCRRTNGHDRVLGVVEGVGSYGAGLSRVMAEAGPRVVEAAPQAAAERRGVGKSDPLDAASIGRSVLGTPVDRLRIPRADGTRNGACQGFCVRA